MSKKRKRSMSEIRAYVVLREYLVLNSDYERSKGAERVEAVAFLFNRLARKLGLAGWEQ